MTKEATRAVWGKSPTGATHAKELLPGTKEFFQTAYVRRKEKEIPFIKELIPWRTFSSRTVLEVGCGPGYDAFDFCKSHAVYIGIDITPENVRRAKKHLSFFGFSPDFVETDAESLPFGNEKFDIVFSNGVLHHTPDMNLAFREVNRVLTKKGKFWVILYNKNSLFYWFTVFLFGHVLNFGFLRRPFRDRLSEIEYTTSDQKPLVNVYSKKQLKKILIETGFEVRRIVVRKLNQEDFPRTGRIDVLWRITPQSIKRFLEKKLGWYIIIEAQKT